MAPNRLGEGLPEAYLIDLQENRIDVKSWQSGWTLLVFLRHLA